MRYKELLVNSHQVEALLAADAPSLCLGKLRVDIPSNSNCEMPDETLYIAVI